MNCVIVDDDETSRFILSNLANKIDDISLVGACKSASEAREIINNKEVELLLLDIEMPGETGIELFEKMSHPIEVIFITSQTKHAVAAFENDAVDYIVKPVNLDRLKQAIEKAKRKKESNQLTTDNGKREFFFIKEKALFEKIYIDDIKYIESTNGYVTFQTTSKKITMNGTLKKVTSRLNKNQFIQVHRSYLININKVSKYDNEHVYIGNSQLPLSRLYKKAVVSYMEKLTL